MSTRSSALRCLFLVPALALGGCECAEVAEGGKDAAPSADVLVVGDAQGSDTLAVDAGLDSGSADTARVDSAGGADMASTDSASADSASADTATTASDAAVGVDTIDPAAPTDCALQTFTLARTGTTSSCGFDLPAEVDHWVLNVYISPQFGVNYPVCRVGGSGSCGGGPGWFHSANQVALCDETCMDFENAGSNGRLVGELGCQSSFCRDTCGNYGEACGGGSNCCPGYVCEPTGNTCVPCDAAPAACTPDEAWRCCNDNCESGRCCHIFTGPCHDDGDCCVGVCERGLCGCAAPEIICGDTCVDPTSDPAHCDGCDLACGSGALCIDSACACDPDDPGLLYCGGDCVDPLTDAQHCGGCSQPCRPDQICDQGCTCAPGHTDCSGVCADLLSDPGHCGDCPIQCSSLHQCVDGDCVCRSDLTLCEGSCVDTQTDDNYCGDCDTSCNGQRHCIAGICQ